LLRVVIFGDILPALGTVPMLDILISICGLDPDLSTISGMCSSQYQSSKFFLESSSGLMTSELTVLIPKIGFEDAILRGVGNRLKRVELLSLYSLLYLLFSFCIVFSPSKPR
jgi:hypothetical protein